MLTIIVENQAAIMKELALMNGTVGDISMALGSRGVIPAKFQRPSGWPHFPLLDEQALNDWEEILVNRNTYAFAVSLILFICRIEVMSYKTPSQVYFLCLVFTGYPRSTTNNILWTTLFR